MVEGVDIDFTELPVQREKPAHNHTFSTEQIHAIDLEVSELLKKGVIRKAHHSDKEYISPICVRPKKDNRWRMILNLKDLNKNVEYFHFKMETLKKKTRFGFSQSKLFFLLAGRERCIFFSTCKRIFTRIPKVLLFFFFFLLFFLVTEGKSTSLANKPGSKTQTAKGTTFDYMRSIRKRLRSSGFSQTASSVICSSWRRGTSRQYATYIARWKRYANKRGIHSVSPSVSEGVNFLGMLFSAGLSYSAICVARSALSSYLDCKEAAQFGEHKRVRQFIKGVFEKRPALPKYSSTWDVDTVLQYLELYYAQDELTLKELSYKLVMLLALLSGQRCQTLHCLSLSSMKMSDSKCVFTVDVLLKRSCKGKHLAPLEFLAFPQNEKL